MIKKNFAVGELVTVSIQGNSNQMAKVVGYRRDGKVKVKLKHHSLFQFVGETYYFAQDRVKIFKKKKKTTRYVADWPYNVRLEVRQQEYGNRNFVLVRRATGEVLGENSLGKVFTVFTKDAKCGRGEYAEELDVLAQAGSYRRRASTTAKKIAEVVLKAEYEEGLRVTKAVERFGLF